MSKAPRLATSPDGEANRYVDEPWTSFKIDSSPGGAYGDALYVSSGEVRLIGGGLGKVGRPQVDDFDRDGFIAVESVLGDPAIASSIAGLDHLIAGGVPDFRGIMWENSAAAHVETMSLEQRRHAVRKIMHFVDYEPRLARLAFDPELLDVVAQLLHAEPALLTAQALLKPPGIGREKPWHQDKSMLDVAQGAPLVGVWIALDHALPENGCMHVIPGSHHAGPIVHFNRRDFQICDNDVQRDAILAVPLPPGAALFFDGLLHHGTPRNTSNLRRWALQFHYVPIESRYKTPQQREDYKRQRLAVFGEEGKDAEC